MTDILAEERAVAFRRALLELDLALTGREATATSQLREVDLGTIEHWYERELYLSDGGYSRLIWSPERGLCLTSNSLSVVKSRWARATVERAVVEHMIAEELERLGG